MKNPVRHAKYVNGKKGHHGSIVKVYVTKIWRKTVRHEKIIPRKYVVM